MGNICRSPSAEGIFARQLRDSNWEERVSIDSAGTHSYHIGHAPDPRAIETAAQFDVRIDHLRARQVRTADFHDFDLIIAMDNSNLANLQAMQPRESRADLRLMMSYHPSGRAGQSGYRQDSDVPDPYYGGMDGFVHMFELLEKATAGLLRDIEGRLG